MIRPIVAYSLTFFHTLFIQTTPTTTHHTKKQDALKFRKGDFDNIVDDVSDGEGDEAAGQAARAEMELAEDRARDRAIITAVTEGHDAMRNKGKTYICISVYVCGCCLI